MLTLTTTGFIALLTFTITIRRFVMQLNTKGVEVTNVGLNA